MEGQWCPEIYKEAMLWGFKYWWYLPLYPKAGLVLSVFLVWESFLATKKRSVGKGNVTFAILKVTVVIIKPLFYLANQG